MHVRFQGNFYYGVDPAQPKADWKHASAQNKAAIRNMVLMTAGEPGLELLDGMVKRVTETDKDKDYNVFYSGPVERTETRYLLGFIRRGTDSYLSHRLSVEKPDGSESAMLGAESVNHRQSQQSLLSILNHGLENAIDVVVNGSRTFRI